MLATALPNAASKCQEPPSNMHGTAWHTLKHVPTTANHSRKPTHDEETPMHELQSEETVEQAPRFVVMPVRRSTC